MGSVLQSNILQKNSRSLSKIETTVPKLRIKPNAFPTRQVSYDTFQYGCWKSKLTALVLVTALHLGCLAAITQIGTQTKILFAKTPIQVALIDIESESPEPPPTAPIPMLAPQATPTDPPPPEPPPPIEAKPEPKPKPVIKPRTPPKPVAPRPVERPAAITELPSPISFESETASSDNEGDANSSPSAPRAALAGPVSDHAGGSTTSARFDAAYLNNPKPRYPPISRRMREQGKVMLKVLVTPEGRAGAVEISRSSGFGRLDSAAVESVRKWRFVPAKRAGRTVESWVLIPIVFNLEG